MRSFVASGYNVYVPFNIQASMAETLLNVFIFMKLFYIEDSNYHHYNSEDPSK